MLGLNAGKLPANPDERTYEHGGLKFTLLPASPVPTRTRPHRLMVECNVCHRYRQRRKIQPAPSNPPSRAVKRVIASLPSDITYVGEMIMATIDEMAGNKMDVILGVTLNDEDRQRFIDCELLLMMQAKWDVIKITEMRDGAVYSTATIRSIWLDVGRYSTADRNAIAKSYGGDALAPRLPKSLASQTILRKENDMLDSEREKSEERLNTAVSNMLLVIADSCNVNSDFADDLHDEGYFDDEIPEILTRLEHRIRSLTKRREFIVATPQLDIIKQALEEYRDNTRQYGVKMADYQAEADANLELINRIEKLMGVFA
jgi:hypothetical protein